MIRGIKIDLGGREFHLPALTIAQLEEFEEDIVSVSKAALRETELFAKERFAAMARVIHAALSRNYPDIALDELRKMLDLENVGRAWSAVMGLSGLFRKDDPAGEANAEAPIGTASAPRSADTPAGTGTTQAN